MSLAAARPTTPRRLPLSTLSRGDAGLLYGLLGLIGLGALFSLVLVLIPPGRPAVVSQAREAGPVADLAGLRPGVTARYSGEIVYRLSEPTIAQRLLWAAPGVVASLLVLGVVGLLVAVLRRLRRDEEFTQPTLRLMWALSLTVTFGGLLWPFVRMGAQFALMTTLQDSPAVLFDINPLEFAPMVVGLFLVALLNVFAKGIRLAADADGLV